MKNIDIVWARIKRHEDQPFRTKTGLPVSYEVPGNCLRVEDELREGTGRDACDGPGDIKDRQGSS